MRNPLAYILYYTHIILEQVSTTLLPEGHINYYIALRWLDILRNVIVLSVCYCTFYQINKCFVNI